MSPEARAILSDWIEEAFIDINGAFVGPVRKPEAILDLIRQIQVVAVEAAYDLEQLHEDAVFVRDESEPDGVRNLTQRETIEAVEVKATSIIEEAKALATVREARAKLAVVRKKKSMSAQTDTADVRTNLSVQHASPDVRTRDED